MIQIELEAHGRAASYVLPTQKGTERRHCLFLLSQSHECGVVGSNGGPGTEMDTVGPRARHDLPTFLPDLKLLI